MEADLRWLGQPGQLIEACGETPKACAWLDVLGVGCLR